MALPLVAATNISTPTSPAHYAVRLRHANSANHSVQTLGKQITHLQDSTCHFSYKKPTNLCSTLCFSKKVALSSTMKCSSGFPELTEPSKKKKHALMLSLTTERCQIDLILQKQPIGRWRKGCWDDLLNCKLSNLNFHDLQTTSAQLAVLYNYFHISQAAYFTKPHQSPFYSCALALSSRMQWKEARHPPAD